MLLEPTYLKLVLCITNKVRRPQESSHRDIQLVLACTDTIGTTS